MLDKAVPTLQHLDEFQPQTFILFMEPPSLDERIVNQAALLSIMSRPKGEQNKAAQMESLNEFLKRNQNHLPSQ